MNPSSPAYTIAYDASSKDFRADFSTGLPSLWRGNYDDADQAARAALAAQRKAAENLAARDEAVDLAIAEAAAAGRGSYEPGRDEEVEVAAWIDELDEETTTTTPAEPARVSYTLPAAELVAQCLTGLRQTASPAEAKALDKAAYEVSRGSYAAVQVAADGALLVPSRSTGGTVYRVADAGCSCPAGEKGTKCWHRHGLYEAVLLARDVRAAQLDDEAEYRQLAGRSTRVVMAA